MNNLFRFLLSVLLGWLFFTSLCFWLPGYILAGLMIAFFVFILFVVGSLDALLLWGFYLGLLFDFFAGGSIGLTSLFFLMLGLILSLIKQRLSIQAKIIRFLTIIFIANFFYVLFSVVKLFFSSDNGSFWWVVSHQWPDWLGQLFASLLIGAGLYLLSKKLKD